MTSSNYETFITNYVQWDVVPTFRAFAEQLPKPHWVKIDLSVMRFGWLAFQHIACNGEPKQPPANLTALDYFHAFLDREAQWENSENFQAFYNALPERHWAKHEMNAIRFGWEARKAVEGHDHE